MLAVDTNVLVRILIDDPKQTEQVKVARHFAKKATRLFVAQIVQVELVWVLSAAYDLAKNDIIFILKHLYKNEAFVLQNEAQYAIALQMYQTSTAGFSDCLIWSESQHLQYSISTFDKKFARLPNVEILK
jgi:predicted nucleic-acid-binding protein